MRLLRKADSSRIFRYHDFQEEETDVSKDKEQDVSKPAFLTFTDEDYFFKAEEPEGAEGPGLVEEAGEPEKVTIEEKVDVFKEAATAAEQIKIEAEQEARNIIEKSHKEADRILAEAEKKAEELYSESKEDGYKEGHEQGVSAGKEAGTKQALSESKYRYEQFFSAIDLACGKIDVMKQELLEQHIDGMAELALAISEKVVCVSLESSGDVIKRMILSAVARSEEKQWAKVTISAKDARLMAEDGINIREELDSVSDKIELIIIDDAERGTCLVEFPEQAMDASAAAQLANIKDMIHGADDE